MMLSPFWRSAVLPPPTCCLQVQRRAAAPGFSVSCTIARFCSSLKRRRFDRPSVASGVKRYLGRAQLAALLNRARALG
jgi:hypothetical protein